MLFTWDTTNLCIVFRWWHITSTTSLLLSLAGVALLTAGYELVRDASRKYEVSSLEYLNKLPSKIPRPGLCCKKLRDAQLMIHYGAMAAHLV